MTSQYWLDADCPACHRVVPATVDGYLHRHDDCDNRRYTPAPLPIIDGPQPTSSPPDRRRRIVRRR